MSIVCYLVTSALILSLAYAQANQEESAGMSQMKAAPLSQVRRSLSVNRNTGLRQEALTTEEGFDSHPCLSERTRFRSHVKVSPCHPNRNPGRDQFDNLGHHLAARWQR